MENLSAEQLRLVIWVYIALLGIAGIVLFVNSLWLLKLLGQVVALKNLVRERSHKVEIYFWDRPGGAWYSQNRKSYLIAVRHEQEYLDPNGNWTTSKYEAMEFDTSLQALKHAKDHYYRVIE